MKALRHHYQQQRHMNSFANIPAILVIQASMKQQLNQILSPAAPLQAGVETIRKNCSKNTTPKHNKEVRKCM